MVLLSSRVKWLILLIPVAIVLSAAITALFLSPIIYQLAKGYQYHKDECRILQIDGRDARVFCHVTVQSWSHPNVTESVEVDKWVDKRPCGYDLGTNISCWTKNNWQVSTHERIRLFRYPQKFSDWIMLTVGIYILFGILATMSPFAGVVAFVEDCCAHQNEQIDEEMPFLSDSTLAKNENDMDENVGTVLDAIEDDGSVALVEMATAILQKRINA